MKIVLMGTAAFAVPALKAVLMDGHQVSLVICQPDRPKGRGHQLQAPPLKVAALELGLPVFQPEKIKEASAVERLRAENCDALCVVAYGQILPQSVLDAPRLMPLNVHASLLPKYRGAAPIEWAVAMGEAETGIAVQKMALKMDAGDVLLSERLAIGADDDASSITPRLAELGASALGKALKALESGSYQLTPQDESQASFAPLLTKSHGIADFSLDAKALFNRFRGFKARPGFHTALGGETLKIHRMSLGAGAGKPGTLIAITEKGFEAACATGSVVFEEIQSAGGKAMPAADWARGRKTALGQAFETPVF